MTRVLLVAALLLGTSSVAAADVPFKLGGYAGLGIGPGAAVEKLPSARSIDPDGRSGQLFAGVRLNGTPILSRFAIEGSVAVNSFVINKDINYDARMIGIAAKYAHPLGAGMDVYGKLGVAHTQYATDDAVGSDVDGPQMMLAVGAQYRIPIAVQLSVLLDYTIYTGDLEGSGRYQTVDAQSRFWKLGFTIGF